MTTTLHSSMSSRSLTALRDSDLTSIFIQFFFPRQPPSATEKSLTIDFARPESFPTLPTPASLYSNILLLKANYCKLFILYQYPLQSNHVIHADLHSYFSTFCKMRLLIFVQIDKTLYNSRSDLHRLHFRTFGYSISISSPLLSSVPNV